MTAPRATYRLQLRAGFGFKETAALAPYLAQLGVSHVYLSPFFKARPGSSHGYDITNHNWEAVVEPPAAEWREALGRAAHESGTPLRSWLSKLPVAVLAA